MVLETSWTVYDKFAGLLALTLMSGYYLAPVQGSIAMAVNLVLSPLATLLPVSVLLFGVAGTTGLYSTTLRLLLGDSERMERLQERIETLQKRTSSSTEEDGDGTDSIADEQTELLRSWLAMLKLQFRPLAWSMLLTVPVFLWIRWAMANPASATVPLALSLPVVGHIALTATLIGPVKVWLVWYIGGSISTSFVSRRVLSRVLA
ncbi:MULTISPECIES: EMC3/TMCO1 family protein [unclassified Haladaptatus]|uniref:DUF106 domain-containing protein n=1 Tax=unclassified Haladaptatus TaxID=2622732 RepID=UPI00209C1CF1|nr:MULTISPECIES: EMC3/TMCO1 family protein [unclassified Haladaptatus]MCO8243879.1 EMC3/TMCO1 family protein [Haladaptatus sp. AB643]MCO8253493.1 EMC3/TMCO1 family protein [Haladaptatus sp. AB618]